MDYVQPGLPHDVRISEVFKNYLLVTKPGIIAGNLIALAGAFFFASKGHIDVPLLLATLSGVSLVIASACIFNNLIDRNLDRKMTRTQNRAIANGFISMPSAVCYASVLGISGVALLLEATNLLCVVITLTGFMIYVGVYSLYLKRHSPSATLIGSLAGAAPPLAGYCAVANRFDVEAVLLLLIFSLWQMPHFYAIAIYRLDDYAAAKIPALPVVLGISRAKKHIIGYILAFMIASLLLTFGSYTGYSYLAVMAALCLSWLYLACSGHATSVDRIWAKKLFVFSVLNMAAVSIMMSIDCIIPATWL